MTYVISLALIWLTSSPSTPKAQEQEHTAILGKLGSMMTDLYVFPEKGKAVADLLNQKHTEGSYRQLNAPTFAKQLTRDLQGLTNDKHIVVRFGPQSSNPKEPTSLVKQLQKSWGRTEHNAGFRRVEVLDGNIGLLELHGFAGVNALKPRADQAMALLADVEALILDLRRNGGGAPEGVQYLLSYFFEPNVHLNSLYWRKGNRTEIFKTLENLPGKSMTHIPIFVLTSGKTFSAAEECTYNLKTQDRATIIGESTGGGAHPGEVFTLGGGFTAFIPTGRAINPITGTNWEGTGVSPHIKTSAENAFTLAYAEAKKTVETKRWQKAKSVSTIVKRLTSFQENELKQKWVHEQFMANDPLSEGLINRLGYFFLYQGNRPLLAEYVFSSNVKLYPNSANALDSYGEALHHNQKTERAIQAYTQAVETAKANGDANLTTYEAGLARVTSGQKQER